MAILSDGIQRGMKIQLWICMGWGGGGLWFFLLVVLVFLGAAGDDWVEYAVVFGYLVDVLYSIFDVVAVGICT